MAAMEGHWDDGPMPLGLVGFVERRRKTTTALEIPGGVSFLDSFTFTKPLPGSELLQADGSAADSGDLPDVPPDDPHLRGLDHRARCGCGGSTARANSRTTRACSNCYSGSGLIPELGIQMGWMAAEIGRQPWIVQGLLRTNDAVSRWLFPAYQIALTILLFFVIYALLFVGWARVVLGLIKKGPQLAAAKG